MHFKSFIGFYSLPLSDPKLVSWAPGPPPAKSGPGRYAVAVLKKIYPYYQRMNLWRVSRILMEPVPYTLVYVNRRNNEAGAHVEMCFLVPKIAARLYGTGSVKIWKTRHEISVYIDGYFLQYVWP